jgi:glycosyltransferase involved in cell wall biosynthesis
MIIGIDCRLWNQTGVGRYIRNLVLNLQNIDKQNNYVLFGMKKDLPNIKSQIASPKWKIVEANIRWHTLAEQTKLPKILNNENLDLMHFPFQAAPFFYKKPFVITIHDLIPMLYSTGKASTLIPPLYYSKYMAFKFLVKNMSKRAKKIIVPSLATKEDVIKHLGIPEDRIVVTYEGVDRKMEIKNQVLRAKDVKKDKYFLYVGVVFPHKNLDRLVQAFLWLKSSPSISNSGSSEDLKLVLVGRRDYFSKRLEKKVNSKDVIFLGEVTDGELSALYKNAIATVQPSLLEGFGLPVLEAMTNKCFVVCSNIPALREVAGDFAIYFDPRNIKDIKKNLEFIIQNLKSPMVEEMKEKAFIRSQDFSFEKMAKETLNVYESIK